MSYSSYEQQKQQDKGLVSCFLVVCTVLLVVEFIWVARTNGLFWSNPLEQLMVGVRYDTRYYEPLPDGSGYYAVLLESSKNAKPTLYKISFEPPPAFILDRDKRPIPIATETEQETLLPFRPECR